LVEDASFVVDVSVVDVEDFDYLAAAVLFAGYSAVINVGSASF
jgi:hypothetical protein